MKKALLILIFGLFGLAVMAAALLAGDFWRFLKQPLPLVEERELGIETGSHLTTILNALDESAGFDQPRDKIWLRAHAKVFGWSSSLQAGEYLLRPGRTALQQVELFKRGEVISYQFTIVEGWNFKQLRAELARVGKLRQLTTDWKANQLMAELGDEKLHPEGQFLPETYSYSKGSSDLDILKRAHVQLNTQLQNLWQQRDENLPLKTPYEALILASIIEKETGLASERPQIAGVFVRRLKKRMRLQTDPTVIYGMGDAFDGNIRRRDLRTDTPYNTYTRHGLPPTPIAMAGHAAIHAALHPADGDALYFVSKGDGSHVFNATLEEHNRDVRRYQLRR